MRTFIDIRAPILIFDCSEQGSCLLGGSMPLSLGIGVPLIDETASSLRLEPADLSGTQNEKKLLTSGSQSAA